VTTGMRELVERHPFMAGVSEESLELVVGCARNVAFAPSSLLCAEGESADTFYLLRRGRVSVNVHAPGRGSIVIETVGPGDVVGWSWLVPPFRWTFDARAMDRVGCIAIDGACLRAKSLTDPSLGFELLSKVSVTLLARLQATRMRLLDLYGDQRVE
jgi:CRP/FNR family cyclic AMP-dependent transcriptional regulator